MEEAALEFARTASRYELFNLIEAACSMRKVTDEACLKYSKMVRTGNLGFHDYGAGFINFEISHVQRNTSTGVLHFARIWFATVDDGDMGAWVEFPTDNEAKAFIEKFANDYLAHLNEFPTLEELNQQLCKYGVWVDHE